MSSILAPAKAHEYAATWGSFIRSGDPGACMYGFTETFTMQHEGHRAECLAWIEGCRANVKADPSNYDDDELAQLDALEAAVKIALNAEQVQAREDRLDEFSRAYMTAALWSSHDESDECGGDPMDDNYGIQHIADETFAAMIEDCQAFQRDHAQTLARCSGDMSQAGHDFWLTRNGHGTGFWDRDDAVWDKAAREELSRSARSSGNVDLYVGDDGRIHG
jgi:hypothetical protein